LTKSGRGFRAPCPFHSEKEPSFFIYPDQQTWRCFGACNTGGDVFSFIMKKDDLAFGDALQFLAEKVGVVIPSRFKSQAEDSERDKIFQINQIAAQYFHNLLINSHAAEKARDYLKKRGLSDRTLTDFQIGYSLPGWESLKQYMIENNYSEEDLVEAGLLIRSNETGKTLDRFRHNIIFPILDDKGRTTGFGARVLDSTYQGPKYTNSPHTRIFDKSSSLYGIHLAKKSIRQKDTAVIVEGYMDVIIAHQYDFTNVISPMGVAITEKQINQIMKLTHNIVLALDPDTAGEEAAMRCVNYENKLNSEVKVITIPNGKDPDELIIEDSHQWEVLVNNAIPVIEYTIDTVIAKLDINATQGKTEAVNKLLPIIAETKAGTRQYQYLTRLSLAVGIDDKKLEAALSSFKTDRKIKEIRSQAIQKAIRPIRSNPVEEYLLAILLQHPEINIDIDSILEEYFEYSENRVIFKLWQQYGASEMLKETTDPFIREHFNSLVSRNIPGDNINERYMNCFLRLQERYLRNLQRKHTEFLITETDAEASSSVHDKLEKLGTKINEELKKIFDAGIKG